METNLNIDFNHRPILKEKMKRDGVNESEDDELTNMGASVTEDDKKKRAAASSGASTKKGSITGGNSTASSLMKICQAEKCFADLSDAKPYHRRHKVCEHHAKAQVAVVAGIRQRFCQQCSRFHELLEFDEAKRSCRRRLAGHNERRRKNPIDNTDGGSRIKVSTSITTGQGQAQAGAPSLLSSSSPVLF